MKINRQSQELHIDGKSSADWVLKQIIERDICLLYYQLSNYSWVMGDLYYGDVYALPYWEYLDFPGIEPEDREFIRDGCLVMILAMAEVCIGGTNSYLLPYVDACSTRIDQLKAGDPDTIRLIKAVRLSLQLIRDGQPATPELYGEFRWVHHRYVRRFFEDRAREFHENPYFREKTS